MLGTWTLLVLKEDTSRPAGLLKLHADLSQAHSSPQKGRHPAECSDERQLG